MCVYVCVYMNMGVALGSPGDGVMNGCELCNIGAET